DRRPRGREGPLLVHEADAAPDEDPERLVIDRGEAGDLALGIADQLVGPGLGEGDVGLAGDDAQEVVEGAARVDELDPEALSGEALLVLPPEGVVCAARLAGRDRDAPRRRLP